MHFLYQTIILVLGHILLSRAADLPRIDLGYAIHEATSYSVRILGTQNKPGH